jgi:hypothetical protein
MRQLDGRTVVRAGAVQKRTGSLDRHPSTRLTLKYHLTEDSADSYRICVVEAATDREQTMLVVNDQPDQIRDVS